MCKHSYSKALLVASAFLVSGMTNEEAFSQDRGQARSMVISQSGIVASESPLASQAGAAVLQRGGNAVDAAIAAQAVMTVVAPMWNGIGGDLFAIVYDAKSGKYYGLNASGWAPAGQSMDGRSWSIDSGKRNSTNSWLPRFKLPRTVSR